MNEYKIIIADDHKILADGLEMIIHSNNIGTVILKVTNGKELLQKLNDHKADLIILDINMPLLDGLKSAELIKIRYPDIKILIITQHESIELINKIKALNVDGYLSKSFEQEELMKAIVKIKNGERIFPLVSDQARKKEFLFIGNEKYHLSEREYEIIQMISKGLTTKQIASQLFLSEHTIDTHRKNIGRKTGAHNSTAILKFVIENNISIES